jgi:hypothetical protein
MFSLGHSTFQRRPALIPSDLHLSSEDERSILLRIGSLHLASPGSQASPFNLNSPNDLSSRPSAGQRPPTVTVTHAESNTPKCGTKRKASTSAEQHHELSCVVEDIWGFNFFQEDQHKTEGSITSHTALSEPALRSNSTSSAENPSLGSADQILSPRSLAG